VEKLALVEHGVNFHKPISIVISMQLKCRFRNPNYGIPDPRLISAVCKKYQLETQFFVDFYI
jgi:hypothetical protein